MIDHRRGYAVVKEQFTESYAGVISHDGWSAQNNTPAGAHQLCHAHLLRNLQYAVDAERSTWAYQVQRLLRKSQRARATLWQVGVAPKLREAVMRYYQEALDVLNHVPLTHPEERRLQKRLLILQLGWMHFILRDQLCQRLLFFQEVLHDFCLESGGILFSHHVLSISYFRLFSCLNF